MTVEELFYHGMTHRTPPTKEEIEQRNTPRNGSVDRPDNERNDSVSRVPRG